MRRIGIVLTVVVIASAVVSTAAHGPTAPPTLSFEVATIKPNDSPSGPSNSVCHGIDYGMPPDAPPPLGRCIMRRLTLNMLVSIAYNTQLPHVSGGPNWAGSDRFDIEAKAEDPSTATRERLREMLRSLLVDRFKLIFHQETSEATGFALVVAKGGPKLLQGSHPGADILSVSSRKPGRLTGTSTSMRKLAQNLGGILGRPVVDRTGLTDIYDFLLDWTPSEAEVGPLSTTANRDTLGPSLFTALQEQLGLRLESGKVPVEMLVIDHAERPTPN